MIDTDKYEGHAEGDWDWDDIDILMDTHGTPIAEMTEGWNTKEATAQLIADAPLLLAEVKRLREALITVQQSLVWDEKDRAMDGDPITLEAFVVQVEQVRSNITEMIE